MKKGKEFDTEPFEQNCNLEKPKMTPEEVKSVAIKAMESGVIGSLNNGARSPKDIITTDPTLNYSKEELELIQKIKDDYLDFEWTFDKNTNQYIKTNKLIKSSMNILKIWMHDPAFENLAPIENRFNGQYERGKISKVSEVKFGDSPVLWSDKDTIEVKQLIAYRYNMETTKEKIDSTLNTIARRVSYHPIQLYLTECLNKWDGKPRMERLFIDFLGVEDDPAGYAREVTKLWLIAAVKRAFEPGCIFDHVLCLLGGQGIGKSKILKSLASEKYFNESLTTLRGDDVKENIQGSWIVELPEGTFLRTTDNNETKQFFTTTVDTYRRKYDKYASELPRGCVFACTSNTEAGFLTDRTGNRRWWILKCSKEDKKKDVLKDFSEELRDQIWGEVVACYLSEGFAGKHPERYLYIQEGTPQAIYAEKIQEDNLFHSELEEKLDKFLNEMTLPQKGYSITVVDKFGRPDMEPNGTKRKKICEGWAKMTPEERYIYFKEGDWDPDGNRLDKTCVDMIRKECLGDFNGKADNSLTLKIVRTMERINGWKDFKECGLVSKDKSKPKEKLYVGKPYRNVRKGWIRQVDYLF